MEVVGINGSINGTAAELRAQGLSLALGEYEHARLKALVNSRTWLREDGRGKALVLLRRHPGTKVVWAASDSLALGARDAARAIGGANVADIIGGIDWTDEALEAVANGQLTLSVGGHLLESLIAMVLLHDHFNGLDFNRDPGSRYLTPMAIADRSSASILQQRMDADLHSVDIRRLSKVRNRQLRRYDFSIDNILELPEASVQ
ncbi:substrate-binding domain-containing protein [Allohahella marinimesophila]|uniref:Periplasmic binding protein domain-containing protein n=1 Tax=Allohahella marinimesophila TaxID=1054972 RepID=A0ABP7NZL7_9GAMM